jgi:hypothetical protein
MVIQILIAAIILALKYQKGIPLLSVQDMDRATTQMNAAVWMDIQMWTVAYFPALASIIQIHLCVVIMESVQLLIPAAAYQDI